MGFARFYGQLYDLMPHERPEDSLLTDDEALDEWWHKFVSDKTREVAKVYGQRAPQSSQTPPGVPTFAGP